MQGDPVAIDVQFRGAPAVALCYPRGAEQNDVTLKIVIHDGDYDHLLARSARVNVHNAAGAAREIAALIDAYECGFTDGKARGNLERSWAIFRALGPAFDGLVRE